MRSVEEANFQNKKVLVRCDLDVPLEDGKILETFRLEHSLPTLKLIIEKGGFPIIAGKIGRPKNGYEEELSTKHLKLFFDKELGSKKYEILENLRFDPREEENSPELAKELAEKADIYVNESFGVSHRKHASMVGVPTLLPSYAGLRLMAEVFTLAKVLESPERPLIAIIGGAKYESKGAVLDKFLEVADEVLVGGRIGLDWEAPVLNHLYLPVDYASGEKDIGPATIELFEHCLSKAKTVIWAGPLGMFEDPEFAEGTKKIAQAIVDSGAFSVIGGGDTVAALRKFGFIDKMSFVSTGGGAMLEFLVKGTLPALDSL